MFWLIVIGTIVLVLALTIVLATRSQKGHAAEAELARVEFFEKTGFTEEPVSEPGDQSLVLRRPTGTIRYVHRTERQGTKIAATGYWKLELSRPLPIAWQIADRAIAPQSAVQTVVKAVADEAFHSKRSWERLFPGPVPTGVAPLDQRAFAFSGHEAALRRIVADPELQELMLACPDLDLIVTSHDVTLNDPTRLNLGALGGEVSAFEANPAVVIRASIAAHAKAIRLLERCAGQTAAAASDGPV